MTFKEFVSRFGVQVKLPGEHHHATLGRVQFDCPWCSKNSSKYRMGFNERTKSVHCWKCGKHDLADTLRELTGAAWSEMADFIKEARSTKPVDTVRVSGKYKEPHGTGKLLPPHERFLRKRGFDPDELAVAYGVRGIGISCDWPWRILMPLYYNGEPVSWTARSIADDSGAKYVTAQKSQEKIHSRDVLFGEDLCGFAIAIVEGPLDVYAGGPGTVCCLGVNPSPKQILRMSKFPVRVVCFDADKEAQKRADKLVEMLDSFGEGETYNVVLETGKDLSRAHRDEVKAFRSRFLENK